MIEDRGELKGVVVEFKATRKLGTSSKMSSRRNVHICAAIICIQLCSLILSGVASKSVHEYLNTCMKLTPKYSKEKPGPEQNTEVIYFYIISFDKMYIFQINWQMKRMKNSGC